MNIGDIFWLKAQESIPHPRVVLEINDSKVKVVSLTSNMKKVSMPGNILLDTGEGNLTKQSIVEVSKNEWLQIDSLGEYIGTLSSERVESIKNSIGFIERTYF